MQAQAAAGTQQVSTRAAANSFMERLELDLAARKRRLAVSAPPPLACGFWSTAACLQPLACVPCTTEAMLLHGASVLDVKHMLASSLCVLFLLRRAWQSACPAACVPPPGMQPLACSACGMLLCMYHG